MVSTVTGAWGSVPLFHPDGHSLQATFRRSWYFGSEAFREKLVKALGREQRGLADTGWVPNQASGAGEKRDEGERLGQKTKE